MVIQPEIHSVKEGFTETIIPLLSSSVGKTSFCTKVSFTKCCKCWHFTDETAFWITSIRDEFKLYWKELEPRFLLEDNILGLCHTHLNYMSSGDKTYLQSSSPSVVFNKDKCSML